MGLDAHHAGEAVIHVDALTKSFGSCAVLQGFSLALHKGENVVVVGRSGSGKSVLIKCMVGLLKPDSGAIWVAGRDVTTMRQEELDRVRREIGFVFQSGALYDSMTIRENLEFHLRNSPLHGDKAQRTLRVKEVLESVGLLHTLEMMPGELSGGMQKRASLARALVLYPKIMLYDEPTTGLDTVTATEISEVIVKVQKAYAVSSLIITHDMQCAKAIADRIVILVNGKAHAVGTYAELAASADPEVRPFFFDEKSTL